jgi:uncharacterized protein (TIGR00251 family)
MDGIEALDIRTKGSAVLLAAKIVPGASRDAVVGPLGESLKIAVSAAAEKGKANKAVCKALAEAVGADIRDVAVVAGEHRPRKTLAIDRMTAGELRRKLAAL